MTTVATPLLQPSVLSYVATPATITTGGSSVLSWIVRNASSTSLDNDIGTVSSTSITVFPSVSTTYNLSATNPNSTVTSSATVTVNATTTGTGTGSVADQIRTLLKQIAALQSQLVLLLAGQHIGGGTSTTTPPLVLPPGQIGKGACIALGRDLHLGDRGNDVMKLQEMLAGDSANGFTVTPTGVFGPITAKAMSKFQMHMGIASSGITGAVGPLTRDFLQRNCGNGLIKNGDETNASSTSSTSSSMWTNSQQSNNDQGDNNDHGKGKGKGNND